MTVAKEAGGWVKGLELFCLFLGLIFYLFVFPHGIHGDGFVRHEGLMALLQTGTIKPLLYSYVGPLFSSPLLLLGKIVKTEHWWMSRYNTFLYLFFLAFFYRQAGKTFGATAARRLILLFLVGTMFPRHIADYYGEVFTTVLFTCSLWWMHQEQFKKGAAAWLLSVWNVPGTLVGAALVSAGFLLQKKQLRFGFLVLLGVMGILGETYLKFGNFFPNQYLDTSGYKNALPYSGLPGFSYPLFFGVLSVLFSYGKGLLFFTPGLLALFVPNLPGAGPWRALRIGGSCYLVGLILIYSRWWCWTGDWFWGPRFYLFSSVLAVFGIFSLWLKENRSVALNLLLLMLITLSVWVSAQGISFGNDNLEYCSINNGYISFICQYVPEFSALWRPFVAEDRGVNGKQLAFLIFHFLCYVVLTQTIWREFFSQCKESARFFWRHLMGKETVWKL